MEMKPNLKANSKLKKWECSIKDNPIVEKPKAQTEDNFKTQCYNSK